MRQSTDLSFERHRALGPNDEVTVDEAASILQISTTALFFIWLYKNVLTEVIDDNQILFKRHELNRLRNDRINLIELNEQAKEFKFQPIWHASVKQREYLALAFKKSKQENTRAARFAYLASLYKVGFDTFDGLGTGVNYVSPHKMFAFLMKLTLAYSDASRSKYATALTHLLTRKMPPRRVKRFLLDSKFRVSKVDEWIERDGRRGYGNKNVNLKTKIWEKAVARNRLINRLIGPWPVKLVEAVHDDMIEDIDSDDSIFNRSSRRNGESSRSKEISNSDDFDDDDLDDDDDDSEDDDDRKLQP